MPEDNRKSAINVGGRTIYSWRKDPAKADWDKVALETRNSYRTRMQEVINALSFGGYEIVTKPKRR